MKKLFLTVAIALMSSYSFAQNSSLEGSTVITKGVSIVISIGQAVMMLIMAYKFVMIGIGLANMSSDDRGSEKGTKLMLAGVGLALGCLVVFFAKDLIEYIASNVRN